MIAMHDFQFGASLESKRIPALLSRTSGASCIGVLLLVALVPGCRVNSEARVLPKNHPASPLATEPDFDPGSGVFELTKTFTLPSGEAVDGSPAREEDSPAEPPSHASGTYSCPMHPAVVRSEPGTCPECGMTLRQTVMNHRELGGDRS